MPTVTLEEAQAQLPDLIAHLTPGEPLFVVHGGKLIAQIVPPPDKPQAIYGRGKGMVFDYDPDDKSHLEGFEEYMQ